jgi:hypothetical protein
VRRALWVGLLALAACTPRTLIHPRTEGEAQPVYVPEGGCNVRDFASATDVPSGARSLGWVTVDQQETDEATYLLLRQRICELGGDALSQPAWVKAPSDESPRLTANAWTLP